MRDFVAGTVVLDRVSKRYRLGTLGTLRGALQAMSSRRASAERSRDLWALEDVSFRIEPGESLGLIGPNGAGKTTALRLLSYITRPTTGRVSVGGRVSALIELGAGFHPELTGRENIFLNGAILGLSRRQVQSKLDEIVAFSGLERFVDTPVKRYSSGMYVRLGFAVAAHVHPNVLLVDEVLAVGDASFRHRCLEHMRSLRDGGTTVVFVSHNMHQVRSMCHKALLLTGGRVAAKGTTAAVIADYEKWLAAEVAAGRHHSAAPDAQSVVILQSVEVSHPDSAPGLGVIESRRPIRLRIRYRATGIVRIGRIDVRILRDDNTLCCTADSSQSVDGLLDHLDGEGTVDLVYSPAQLTTGRYTAVVRVTDSSDEVVVASSQSVPFLVHADSAGSDRGIYVPQVTWSKSSDRAACSGRRTPALACDDDIPLGGDV